VAASSYNSLQVKAQKRLGDGGSLLLAYTHSKLISDTDALTAWLEPAQAGQPSIGGAYGAVQDSNSIRGERSLSSNDAPDHLVFGYVVDLPVGRGRRLLSHPSPLINTVVGGWGLDGMITLQSGFPLFFATASNVTNSFGGGSRPNVLAGCQKSVSGSAESRLNDWFNKACFSQPPAFTFGTEPRTDPNLRSDGIANWDFAAFKNFAFADDGKVKVQFRGEFFNFLNHPQFGAPGTTLGAAGFGVVSSQINSPRLVQLALRMSY
jgi:hypothetical protein